MSQCATGILLCMDSSARAIISFFCAASFVVMKFFAPE
jgi:hypothetical protein